MLTRTCIARKIFCAKKYLLHVTCSFFARCFVVSQPSNCLSTNARSAKKLRKKCRLSDSTQQKTANPLFSTVYRFGSALQPLSHNYNQLSVTAKIISIMASFKDSVRSYCQPKKCKQSLCRHGRLPISQVSRTLIEIGSHFLSTKTHSPRQ